MRRSSPRAEGGTGGASCSCWALLPGERSRSRDLYQVVGGLDGLGVRGDEWCEKWRLPMPPAC
jgi:hypothetical protein